MEQADTVQVEEDYNLFLRAYEDSLRRLGIDEKIHHLDEVEVKARKRDKASDVYQARTKSIAYYDVASEMDDIQDRNGFVGDDIHELMRNMNPDFYTQFSPSGDTKAVWLCLSSTMSVPATRKWTSTNIVV